jgi:hypothetical protein
MAWYATKAPADNRPAKPKVRRVDVAALSAGPTETPAAYSRVDDESEVVAKATTSTSQPIPSGVGVTLALDTDQINPRGLCRLAPDGWIVPVDGIYRISAMVRVSASDRGERGLGFLVEGSPPTDMHIVAAAVGPQGLTHAALLSVKAGQAVKAVLWQTSGEELFTLAVDPHKPCVCIELVARL